MKKIILLNLLILLIIFGVTGCGKLENKPYVSSDKTYTIEGVEFKLDKKEDYEKKIYYLTSSKFKSRYSASTGNRLTLLKNENGEENLENTILMIYVNVQELKTINGIEWSIYTANGKTSYGFNKDYSNIVIGFIYDDSELSKFEEEFMNNITLNEE